MRFTRFEKVFLLNVPVFTVIVQTGLGLLISCLTFYRVVCVVITKSSSSSYFHLNGEAVCGLLYTEAFLHVYE